MKVTLSEAIDRLTILTIKLAQLPVNEPDIRVMAARLRVATEQENVAAYVQELLKDLPADVQGKIPGFTRELTTTNNLIFEAVAFIETSDEFILVAGTAKKAQVLNRQRSRIKNAIEEAVGSEVREVKI